MNQEQKLKLYEQPRLDKFDTFTFGCNVCGECCRNRDGENSIFLNALDIFKISKHLKLTITDFLSEYARCYCGENSKLPLVIIKAKPYRGACPFLKGKCTIHTVKPAICALFPLGRVMDDKSKKLTYVLNETNCGDKKTTQTVEEWLTAYNLLDEEPFALLWQQRLIEYAKILDRIFEKLPNGLNGLFEDFLFLGSILYLNYDVESDFMPQFEEKSNAVMELLTKIENDLKTIKKGTKE